MLQSSLETTGTRPRLPSAPQLRELVANPAPNLLLLDALVEDPSPYVRRSVANHLNDIAKDHAELALDLATAWAKRGPDATTVVRHGLRTLVKQGNSRALALAGTTVHDGLELRSLAAIPSRIAIGDVVTFTITLAAPENGPPYRGRRHRLPRALHRRTRRHRRHDASSN